MARKRAFDLLIIALLAPLILVIALVVGGACLFTTGHPLIFSQDRIGLRGRVFRMRKFRTMRCDAPGGPVTLDDDDRVTRLGGFLRRSHLDELPQILNVIAGDMSLIGPRPEQPALADQYTRLSPDFARRLQVLPGITGLAQVRCGYAADHAQTLTKLAYDLQYIDHQDLVLDVRILLATAVVMARGCGR